MTSCDATFRLHTLIVAVTFSACLLPMYFVELHYILWHFECERNTKKRKQNGNDLPCQFCSFRMCLPIDGKCFEYIFHSIFQASALHCQFRFRSESAAEQFIIADENRFFFCFVCFRFSIVCRPRTIFRFFVNFW